MFAVKHARNYLLSCLFEFNNFMNFILSLIKSVKFKPIINFKKFERHNYESNRLLDFGSLVRQDYTSIQECIHEITPHRSLRRRSKRRENLRAQAPASMPASSDHFAL